MDSLFFIKIAGIILLLGLSAFFSGSETAFFSLRRWKVERLRSASKSGFQISELLRDPRGLLVTILIGNEIVNVTVSNLAAIIRRDHFSHFGSIGIVVAMGAMTTLLFLFGEVTPKSIAVYIPERWSTLASRPMKIVFGLFTPLRKFLTKIMDLFDRIFLNSRKAVTQGMTLQELRSIVKESAGESGLTHEEANIVDSIFELGETAVKTVMVPRTEMIFMKEEMSIKEAYLIAGKTKFSRFPVMGKDSDDIKGIIYSKDLLSAYYGMEEAVYVRNITKPAFFVPETKQAFALLREFQVSQMHMAIVLDEYGGTAGLVTLDDILSDVVGEFMDRYRPSSYQFKKISSNIFIINGNLSLQDFNELSDATLEDPDVETMAGYVTKLLGRIPQREDEVQDLNFEFRVLKMVGKRVAEIQARRIQARPDESY